MASVTQKSWLKERLRYLGYSICGFFLAAIGFLGDVGYYYQFAESGWQKFSWSVGIAALLLNACLIGGSVVFFGCLRRCLFPEDGRLMQSVLSQQSAQRETAAALLAQIDEDLAKGAVHFGRLRVGSEWILGDEAMRLSRLRGIFSSKERVRVMGNFPRWVYKLFLIDMNNEVQWTLMTRESELDDAVQYLSERVPEAFVGDEEDMEAFAVRNQAQILSAKTVREAAPAQAFNFVGVDGVPSSRFNWKDVEQALSQLQQGQSVGFELLKPERISDGAVEALECQALDGAWMQVCLHCSEDGGRKCRYVQELEREAACGILEDYFYRRALPEIAGWQRQNQAL